MHRRRRGANLIEFALCLPVFIFIVSGFFDFGWLAYHRAMTDSAVHIGCRAGAVVDPIDADPAVSAEDAMSARLAEVGVPCGGTCTVTAEYVGTVPSRSLSCHIERDIEPLFGLTLSQGRFASDTRMRLEWQRSGT